MRFLDRRSLPTNAHHLHVLTSGHVLPVVGIDTPYPVYYLRFRFEDEVSSLFDLMSCDGPEAGQHRLVASIVPRGPYNCQKDDMLESIASSAEKLSKLWDDLDAAIQSDRPSRAY